MRALLVASFVLCAARASSGPIESHTASATGYPGAYLGSVSISLASDSFYGSRLLDSFELHLRSVAAMTAPRAVADYLEVAVVGARSAREVKAALGTQPIEPQRAAALMLAHALARPEQFHEVLEGLESRKPGLGKQTAKLLREVSGRGDRRLLAALRARGEEDPKGKALTYDRFGQLDRMFDGGDYNGADTVEIGGQVSVPTAYSGYGPDGRPRRSGLAPYRD